MLEVDASELRRERVRALGDEAHRVLREADIPWRSIEPNERGVSVLLRADEQREVAADRLAALSSPVGAARRDLSVTPRDGDRVELTLTQ